MIVEKAPIVLVALKWLGFFYLLYFAYTCFRDALKSHSLTVDESAPSTPDNGEAPPAPIMAQVAWRSPSAPWHQRRLSQIG